MIRLHRSLARHLLKISSFKHALVSSQSYPHTQLLDVEQATVCKCKMSSRPAVSSVCRACGQRSLSSRSNVSRQTFTSNAAARPIPTLRCAVRSLSTTLQAQVQPVNDISLSSTTPPAEAIPTSVPPSATTRATQPKPEPSLPEVKAQQKLFTATITSIHNLTAHASYNKQHWDPRFSRYYTKEEHVLVHDPAHLASQTSGQDPSLSTQISYSVQVGNPLTTATASGEAVSTQYISLSNEQAGALFGEGGAKIRTICETSSADINSAEHYQADGKASRLFRVRGNAAAAKKAMHSIRTSGVSRIDAAIQSSPSSDLYTCEITLPGELRLHLNHGTQHDISSQSGACIFIESADLEVPSAGSNLQRMRKVSLVGDKTAVETALSLIKVQDKSWAGGEARSVAELKRINLSSASAEPAPSPQSSTRHPKHHHRPALLRVGDVVRLGHLTSSELAVRQTRKTFFDELELARKTKSAGKHRKQIVNDHVRSKARRTRTNRGMKFAVREILTPFGDSLDDRVNKLQEPGTGLASSALQGLDATTVLGGEKLAWWKRREGRGIISK